MSRHEHAIRIPEGPSLDLANRIAAWIVAEARQEESWVVGVYGERGAGKTSVLLTLLDVLRKHDHADRLALPTARDDNDRRADIQNLLKPADLRVHDKLLFELLRHLDNLYEKSTNEQDDPFFEAREIEVRRKDIKRFLRYEEEVGVSQEELRKSNIQLRKAVASSTIELKQAFKKIISRLRFAEHRPHRGEKTLVLFVDDLDLHPERTLELLEIFHIFLDQPGVVIILAADKSLLLDSIELGLKRDRGLKKKDRPALAAALLAKYVPYDWHISVPTEAERFDTLWPQPGHELERWWPSDEQARKIPRPTEREPGASDSSTDEAEPYESSRQLAQDLIGALLPATYRGLHGFANRLRHVCDELGCNTQDRITLEKHAPHFESLALGTDMLPAFLSGVLAFDILCPRHMFWNRVRTSPRDVYLGFEALLLEEDVRDGWQFLLRDFARLSLYEQQEDKNALRKLAHLWKTLQQYGKAREIRRFLAISLSLDARDKARPLWKTSDAEEQVNDWHIDLRDWIDDPDHATREELVAARKEAASLLREKDIASSPVGVDVFLKANLPLAVWLGWKLRKLQDIQVFNERKAVFTAFSSPGHELDVENATDLELLKTTPSTGDGPSNEAVLIIDPLGNSKPEQLDAFHDEQGNPVEYSQGVHLSAHLDHSISPEHTEPFLRDCVEALGQLKRQGIEHVHLGLAMPDTLAFLLGQQLHARVARISLYEYRRTQSHYEYIFDLE